MSAFGASAVAEAGATLAAVSRRLAALGWMPATAGNLSVRLPGQPLRFAITASGLDKGELEPSEVAVVGADGRALEPDGPRPSAEAGLHARLYRRFDAGAVVHTHPVEAVVAAARHPDGVRLAPNEMAKVLGRSADERLMLAVVPNSQDMDELADRVEGWADERGLDVPAVLVRDHGVYTWGPDLTAARHHLEAVVWLCRLVLAQG